MGGSHNRPVQRRHVSAMPTEAEKGVSRYWVAALLLGLLAAALAASHR